jgi:Protein of unknown function (DUF2934)
MHSDQRSIGELAYQLWRARGCPEGNSEQDWLEAERQLAAAPAKSQSPVKSQSTEAVDSSLKDTFPASDPPATQGPDLPPSNADEKWRAAGVSRTSVSSAGSSSAGVPRKKAPGGAVTSKSRRAPADKRE